MTINDSRVWNGTLSLTATVGAGPFTALSVECQVTNCRVTSAYSDDGNPVTTLCGDTKGAPRKVDGYKLEGTLVQDFDFDEASGGVQAFIWNHELEPVTAEFVPDDSATAPTFTGTVILENPDLGGDVKTRLTTDISWNFDTKPDVVWGAGAAAAASKAAATKAA